MRWLYAPEYDYGRNLPRHRAVHGFALDRASRIRQHLITADVCAEADFTAPTPVSEAEVAEVHDPGVVADLRDAFAVSRVVEFEALALLPPEVVWEAAVAPQLWAAGGTCDALAVAAEDGSWSANLSGGFHHARPDLSHGSCLVNDLALAVARLRRSGRLPRILVVDLDLHQGDGNAAFFAKEERVFTFSMHEQAAFPVPKALSDLDVGLPQRTGDEDYLARLELGLAEVEERFSPEVVVYVAGSDPFSRDPLGTLQLSPEGLVARDGCVARFAADRGCALVTLPAGGYCHESAALSAAGLAEIAGVAVRAERG
jgi:acetoin utilization deacetylase AcuC-like enzyme